MISLKFSVVALFRQNGIDRWRKQKNIDISLDENLDLFHVSSVEFDWNPAKRAKTIADRAVDFAEVLPGFEDPLRKVTVDSRKDYGEVRFNMLAKCTERIFHITFTMRGAVTWIISARKANKREQRRYEQT